MGNSRLNASTDPAAPAGVDDDAGLPRGPLVTRALFGGALMGLANLVPGISGGTMLLAAGIYPRFIDALAEVTRLRFRFPSLLVLGCVAAAAAVAILLLAGTLKGLVVDHRWVMYSLFIGLTLGGVPVVWQMARPASIPLVASGLLAFALMAALALLRGSDGASSAESNPGMLLVAGLAGASAMILPGISGGYLLLLLGQYVPILSAIDDFQTALRALLQGSGDVAAVLTPALHVGVPVGLGVVGGVVAVGNLLQWLLHHQRRITLGGLLGLLLGSVVGLWPFQQPVAPQLGDTVKGRVVTAESIAAIDPDDWPTRRFTPTSGQVAGAGLLIAAGFAATIGVSQLGRRAEKTS